MLWARLKVGRGRAFDHARGLSCDWRGHQVDCQSLATSACTNVPSTLRNRIGQQLKTFWGLKKTGWSIWRFFFAHADQNYFEKAWFWKGLKRMKGFKRKIISNHLKFMSLVYVSIDAYYVGYVSMHKSSLRNRIGQQLNQWASHLYL